MAGIDAKIPGLIVACGVVAAVFSFGPEARAAEMEFGDISWRRHDTTTGFLEWELHARKAWYRSNNRYACEQPRLNTYRLTEEGGVRRSTPELSLKANEGTYVPGVNKSAATLNGNVETILHGRDPLHITTDDAILKSAWDDKKRTKVRTITSESKVVMDSVDRTLTGYRMTLVDRTEDSGTDKAANTSVLTVYRDVKMQIRGTGGAASFPSILGTARPDQPPAEPEPVNITCRGPFVFDRTANLARFHNSVVLVRGGATMTSDKLTLAFQKPEAKDKTGPQLKRLIAESNVTISSGAAPGKGQRFKGSRFEWRPAIATGKLTGEPARMTSPGTVARADLIEFNQTAGTIGYLGNAVVRLELKAK